MKQINEGVRIEAVRLRIEERKSLSEISKILLVSKSTLSVWLREFPLEKEEITDKLKENYDSTLKSLLVDGSSQKKNSLIKEGFEVFWEKIPSYKRGLVGEALVKYQLLRRGIEILEPSVLEPGCDIVVHTDAYYRCEIKSSTTNEVNISHTKFLSNGGYKVLPYTKENNIDFFICVLLNKEEIYIVPFEETVGHSRTLFLGSTGIFTQFKDRYDLFYKNGM